MKKSASYFCPDDGWEGIDPICPICSQRSEPLDVAEDSGKPKPTLDEEPTVIGDVEPLEDELLEEGDRLEKDEDY